MATRAHTDRSTAVKKMGSFGLSKWSILVLSLLLLCCGGAWFIVVLVLVLVLVAVVVVVAAGAGVDVNCCHRCRCRC